MHLNNHCNETILWSKKDVGGNNGHCVSNNNFIDAKMVSRIFNIICCKLDTNDINVCWPRHQKTDSNPGQVVSRGYDATALTIWAHTSSDPFNPLNIPSIYQHKPYFSISIHRYDGGTMFSHAPFRIWQYIRFPPMHHQSSPLSTTGMNWALKICLPGCRNNGSKLFFTVCLC